MIPPGAARQCIRCGALCTHYLTCPILQLPRGYRLCEDPPLRARSPPGSNTSPAGQQQMARAPPKRCTACRSDWALSGRAIQRGTATDDHSPHRYSLLTKRMVMMTICYARRCELPAPARNDVCSRYQLPRSWTAHLHPSQLIPVRREAVPLAKGNTMQWRRVRPSRVPDRRSDATACGDGRRLRVPRRPTPSLPPNPMAELSLTALTGAILVTGIALTALFFAFGGRRLRCRVLDAIHRVRSG